MGDYVRLRKDGLFEYEWDSETRTYPSKIVPRDEVLSRLRMKCLIDPDVTLLDIFETVDSYKLLKAFIAQYSWCTAIDEFHAAARLPRPINDDDNVAFLEVSKYAETHTYNRHDVGSSIDICTSFHGVGKPGDPAHYGLSLSPVNELAHLTVKVNQECPLSHNFEETGKWEACLSLLEVLDAIYDEISFHGSPAESKAFGAELLGMIDDVESGRAKTVPFEDVFKPETVN